MFLPGFGEKCAKFFGFFNDIEWGGGGYYVVEIKHRSNRVRNASSRAHNGVGKKKYKKEREREKEERKTVAVEMR